MFGIPSAVSDAIVRAEPVTLKVASAVSVVSPTLNSKPRPVKSTAPVPVSVVSPTDVFNCCPVTSAFAFA